MVSNITFLYIHQRLSEIFGFNNENPFTKKTVLIVGDILQVPPVKSSFVFASICGPLGNMLNL